MAVIDTSNKAVEPDRMQRSITELACRATIAATQTIRSVTTGETSDNIHCILKDGCRFAFRGSVDEIS
jgi:hypothetical protein